MSTVICSLLLQVLVEILQRFRRESAPNTEARPAPPPAGVAASAAMERARSGTVSTFTFLTLGRKRVDHGTDHSHETGLTDKSDREVPGKGLKF